MKEVVLTKDLPYLRIDVDAGLAQSIGPVPSNTGDFGEYVQASGTNELFVHTSTIDIAGLTKQELTFFPIAGDCQRPASSMGVTQAFVVEWIIVAASPIDFSGTTINTLNMWNHLPGQLPSTRSFENIMWGKAWTWTLNTNLLQNFAVAVNTTLLGSGEATNADKLYVYRLLFIYDTSSTGLTNVTVPPARVLFAISTKEEATYSYMMRLKRSYDLQQSPDVD
mgnify:CR=1 FL=1